MRNRRLWLTVLICLLFFRCATHKKITYQIPANYPENKKAEFVALLDKGKVLFKANCSECHGVFTKGKEKVPNFTNTQIDNYSSRFLRGDPKNHAVLAKMSQEQMNEVLSFLKYKKPDNPDSTIAAKRRRF
jgi:mono/diheme cytochrome c family protein